MPELERSRFVVVSGPSCAGKSPLVAAARSWFHDDFAGLERLVVYHSRTPRPHERDGVDYHFRSRAEIEALAPERHLVIPVRDQLQAIDMHELARTLGSGGALYEGDYRVATALLCDERVRALAEVLSVFVAPLSAAEINDTRDREELQELVTALMRHRLLRRLRAQHPDHGLPELEDVERRARDAMPALEHARHFEWVIVNHDGEDSDHWTLAARPLGDARRATLALQAILRGHPADGVERWPEGLIG